MAQIRLLDDVDERGRFFVFWLVFGEDKRVNGYCGICVWMHSVVVNSFALPLG